MNVIHSSKHRCIAVSLFLLFGVLGCNPTRSTTSSDLRVLTFNVLVDVERDWDARKERSLEAVRSVNADLIGLEENTPNQLAFFQKGLPEYSLLGPIPLTEKDIDAISALIPPFKLMGISTYTDVVLFFRSELFEKVEEGHWWLSPTGEQASVGFGNAFPRLAVWAKLRHKATNREIVAVVTHFDNSQPSQEKMAALMHEKLKPFAEQKLPIVFMGDFNTDQDRGDYPLLTSDGWRDSYLASPKASPTGKDNNVPTSGGRGRIDHIFYFGEGLKAVEWMRVDRPDSMELSDHYPVFARFEWK